MDVLISVVTGFYNRGSFVKSSIGSLLNQTYQNIEVIVFDDNSTDNTYEELLKIKDKRLRVIRHSINVGFVTGLINAIKQSSGEYIAIHGSGDISRPERLQKQYEVLSSSDEIGVVGCNVLNFDRVSDGRMINTERKCKADRKSKADLIDGGNCFTHGEVMMKRKYYDMVGGYRRAFYYTQDRDLWLRLMDVCKFGVVDEILYERIYIPNSLRFNLEKVIIQKKYSELARQCAELKDNGREDLVDMYGIHAIGFLKKSKRLSSFYYKLFLDYLYENSNISLKCLKLAIDEYFCLSSFISYYLIKLLGFNKFANLFKVILSLNKSIIQLKNKFLPLLIKNPITSKQIN